MNELIDERLVEEAIDAYADWRRECAGVWDANERSARATVADARFAFSAYRAALDREERAAHVYAERVNGHRRSATGRHKVRQARSSGARVVRLWPRWPQGGPARRVTNEPIRRRVHRLACDELSERSGYVAAFGVGAQPADAVPQAPSALPASSPKRFEDATFRLRSAAL